MSKPRMLGSQDDKKSPLQEQYLFLLELYVNYVTGERLEKLNQMFFVPTSISFEFLNFKESDEIEVSPVDPMFHPQAGIADEVEYFYSGRSVLFAIEQQSVTNKILNFILKMSVRKKMPEGIKPDIFVGVAGLDLSHLFAALRKEMLQCWQMQTPPPKTFEGDAPLMYKGKEEGKVNIYVRLSAFGQTIVTEFEAPCTDRSASSFVFKSENAQEKPLSYKCRKIDSTNVDIFQDSKENLRQGACQICTDEYQVCSPCGQLGAKMKPARTGRTVTTSAEQRRTNPTVSLKASKSMTCSQPVPSLRSSMVGEFGPGPTPCGKAVVLKVSGLLNTGDPSKRTPTVTVASEAEATGPHNPDPDHDVFILRIGKKGLVGAGEKSDIQLEMRTPKGIERRPPVRCETREVQTEDDSKKKKKKKKKGESGYKG